MMDMELNYFAYYHAWWMASRLNISKINTVGEFWTLFAALNNTPFLVYRFNSSPFNSPINDIQTLFIGNALIS